MNKIITIAGSVLAGVTLPFLGMSISPTRDAILSLAPEEAVLTLADKIDENRVLLETANEQNLIKINELQSTIDTQQVKLAEQQQLINKQNVDIESAKASVTQTANAVSNEAECRKLYLNNPDCNNPIYRSKSKLDAFIERGIEAVGKDYNKKDKLDKFEKCQPIITKCG